MRIIALYIEVARLLAVFESKTCIVNKLFRSRTVMTVTSETNFNIEFYIMSRILISGFETFQYSVSECYWIFGECDEGKFITSYPKR